MNYHIYIPNIKIIFKILIKMGKKKRFIVGLKPFCYYCDKEFNNDNILHYHQRARHFSCPKCKDRFSSALAVKTHILQIHKEDLKTVPNSISGRENFDVQIFGMDGVPLVLIESKLREKIKHKRRKLAKEGFIELDAEEMNEKTVNRKKFKKEINNKSKNINSFDNSSNNLNFPMNIGVSVGGNNNINQTNIPNISNLGNIPHLSNLNNSTNFGNFGNNAILPNNFQQINTNPIINTNLNSNLININPIIEKNPLLPKYYGN